MQNASTRDRSSAATSTSSDTTSTETTMVPIEEVHEEIPAEEFRDRYLEPARPVVFRGVASWVKEWSFERLRREYGDTPVRASSGNPFHSLDPEYRNVRLADVIDSIEGGGPMYLVMNHFKDVFPTIGEDFERHGFFTRYFAGPRVAYKYLWLNRPGLRSTFHQDSSFDNLNFLVHGRKRFLVISPSYWDAMYPVAFTRSHVDAFAPDYEKYPRFRNVVCQEATLEPGWHNALTLVPSINMNTFALMPNHRWADSAHIPFTARVAVGAIRRYPGFWFRDSYGRIDPVLQATGRRCGWDRASARWSSAPERVLRSRPRGGEPPGPMAVPMKP